jgi:hypothetical protein
MATVGVHKATWYTVPFEIGVIPNVLVRTHIPVVASAQSAEGLGALVDSATTPQIQGASNMTVANTTRAILHRAQKIACNTASLTTQSLRLQSHQYSALPSKFFRLFSSRSTTLTALPLRPRSTHGC